MIEGLKPYVDYKETGAPWFGVVPKHWNVGRLGAVLGERGETNERREVTNILSVMKDRGVIPYAEKGRVGNKASDDIGRYKIVRPDDLVVNCMNVIIGSVGRSRYTGCLSPVYYVLKRRKAENEPRFLELLFQHKQFQQSLVRIGNGILAHRMRIPMEKLKAEMFPLPPPDEQAAIVRFLDHANRKIDGFIRAKRKLIGLLNEQKQAIIHRAVTRGLHPDVPLKSSGIPWLGDIPAHWQTIRCGGLFREVVDVGHPKARLLSIDRFKGIIPQDETGRRTRASYDRGAYKRVKRGQLAYNLMNAFMGALGFSPYDGIVSPAYAVAQPLREIETRYFHYLLRTSSYTGEFNRLSYGIMYERNRLYFERFKVVRALLPPLDEQKAIADWIEANTGTLNTAIARTEREIALMQEYRTRLTADIVTGKLDVREAAAKLPATIDEGNAKEPSNEISEESEEEILDS